MAFADTQKLVVELSLAGNFTRQIAAAKKSLLGFDKTLGSTTDRLKLAQHQIGTGLKNATIIGGIGVAALSTQVVAGLRSLEDLEDAMAQTEAVIKSTGKAAGVSAEQVRKLAEKYESLNATVGDEVIQSAENLLLTFTNIRKEAFEPTLQAALDMNQALGRGPDGLTDTMRILGKALNDPAKGLTALQRLGIRLTDAQKDQIDSALKVNDTYAAQQVILAELDKRFGGSFLAGGGTTRGKVAKFRDAIEDIQRLLATALLPTVGKVADALSKMLADPAIQKGAEELGKGIASLFSEENLRAGADILRSVFETARAAAPVVAAAAKTMAGIVSTAVSVFRSLPPEIQQLAIGAFAINKLTGGLVTNLAGGLISAVLKQLVSGVVNVNGTVVNVNGGVGGTGATGGVAGAVKTGATALTGVVVLGIAQSAAADLTTAIAGKQAGQIQRDLGGGPVNIAGPLDRLIRALHGDFRSGLEVAQNTDKLIGKFDIVAGKVGGLSQDERETRRAADRVADAVHNASAQDRNIAATNQAAAFAIRDKVATSGSLIQTAVNNARAAITATEAAARHAGQQAAAAIRDKDLSVTTNVNVSTSVSVRENITKQTTYKKYYTVAS